MTGDVGRAPEKAPATSPTAARCRRWPGFAYRGATRARANGESSPRHVVRPAGAGPAGNGVGDEVCGGAATGDDEMELRHAMDREKGLGRTCAA